MAEQAEQTATPPQETPTPNSGLGHYKSLEAKQRALANLRAPRKPGDPPLNPNNLGGRPRKDGIFTSTARKFAKKKFPNDPAARTYGELVVEGMFKAAIKGNVFAAQLLFERLEGRMPLPIESDMPVNIVVNVVRNQPRFPEIDKRLIEGETSSSSKAND